MKKKKKEKKRSRRRGGKGERTDEEKKEKKKKNENCFLRNYETFNNCSDFLPCVWFHTLMAAVFKPKPSFFLPGFEDISFRLSNSLHGINKGWRKIQFQQLLGLSLHSNFLKAKAIFPFNFLLSISFSSTCSHRLDIWISIVMILWKSWKRLPSTLVH